jgi:anti-sigma factor RsiW
MASGANSDLDLQGLSAWVDGEAEAAGVDEAVVEAWLREHPEDAATVGQWKADRDALLARLGPLADDPVSPALQRLVLRHEPARWQIAAAAAGLVVAGAALGAATTWTVQHRDPLLAAGTAAGWVERAFYAHAVYVPEPRHPVEVKAQEAHLSRWLTARIQVPVKLFDLQAQGFELVGGRLLPDGPGKSAQLMYQNAQGQRVTVYLRKPEDGADAAFRYERQGDLGLFYWVESGAGYALVGALPRSELLALAETIYRQGPALPSGQGPALPAAQVASQPRS